jgi:hypothetical protein
MKIKNSITKHSIIAGVFVCSFFPLLIFSDSYFIFQCIQICDFGIFWNPIFWGILFPLFIIFLFWNTAKKNQFFIKPNTLSQSLLTILICNKLKNYNSTFHPLHNWAIC